MTAGAIVCPLCRAGDEPPPAGDGHEPGCAWGALEARVEKLEAQNATLLRTVQRLDDQVCHLWHQQRA